jgi:hypothetical protein
MHMKDTDFQEKTPRPNNKCERRRIANSERMAALSCGAIVPGWTGCGVGSVPNTIQPGRLFALHHANFTTVRLRIDSSAASIIRWAVTASSSVESGFSPILKQSTRK